MSDLIKREDAIKAVTTYLDLCCLTEAKFHRGMEDYNEEISTEIFEKIEPKRGEWIPCTKSGLPLTELMRREGQKWYGYRCSNCNHIYKGNALKDCNFCCCCGADMRGKGND